MKDIEFRVERGPVAQNEPFAIGMAKLLEREGRTIAAAELRRLYQFAEDQVGRATAAEAALQMTKGTHALKIAAFEAQRDALLEALLRIESAVDWYLGRSSFTQTTQLKGLKHSANVRKELFAAHDKARAVIKAVEETK